MRLTFRGWQREVTAHRHNVAPVQFSNNRYRAQPVDQPVRWNGPLSALGKVSNLGLTGSFLVEFSFETTELQSWLKRFARDRPAEALRLIASAQAEALISLSKVSAPEADA